MNEINQKLEELAKTIIYIHGDITWNEQLVAFRKALDIILFIKNQEYVEDKQWLVLRKLTDELLKKGIDRPVIDIKSYKRNRLYDLTLNVMEEVKNIPYIEDKSKEILSIDDWVESLKIFKLAGSFLSMDYFHTSDDLFYDLRKIILNSSALYKRIYVGRVVEKLDRNQRSIPKNLDLRTENYELFELIRIFKNNPNYNIHLMKKAYSISDIDYRFTRCEQKNKILLMTKE